MKLPAFMTVSPLVKMICKMTREDPQAWVHFNHDYFYHKSGVRIHIEEGLSYRGDPIKVNRLSRLFLDRATRRLKRFYEEEAAKLREEQARVIESNAWEALLSGEEESPISIGPATGITGARPSTVLVDNYMDYIQSSDSTQNATWAQGGWRE